MRSLSLSMIVAVALVAPAMGQIAFGPDVDPNINGLVFDQSDFFNFGVYGLDDTAVDASNNDFTVIVASGVGQFNDGAGYAVRLSNGENGNDGDDPMNPDPMNTEPANSIFTTIGNASGRLENGNVVRYSQWLRHDPAAPIMVEPAIEPIMKIEFWTEGLSGNADFNSNPNPAFGDRIFDTDQNGSGLLASYIDLTNDGDSANPLLLPPDFALDAAFDWTLVSTTYEVDDTNWGYTDPAGMGPVAKTVSDVEEIRAVTFVGDFAGTDLTNGGAFWLDNPMVEIYNSMADVPAMIPNPFPMGNPTTACDFDESTTCDVTDLDLLGQEIIAGTNNLDFDLTGDNMVNNADRDEWLAQAATENGFSEPYQLGDVDLNGVVDGPDFVQWNNNKFSTPDPATPWSQADFNFTNNVDGQDFVLWNNNKFDPISDGVGAVPEPTAAWLLLLGALGLAGRRSAK